MFNNFLPENCALMR